MHDEMNMIRELEQEQHRLFWEMAKEEDHLTSAKDFSAYERKQRRFVEITEEIAFLKSSHSQNCGCLTCDETNAANYEHDVFWWEEDGGVPDDEYLAGTY